MKAVILYTPVEGRAGMDARRFAGMAEQLERGGIHASCHLIDSVSRLRQAVVLEKPEIAYSAAYYTRDDSGGCESIHELLEQWHIPYIGSSSEVLELVLSKFALKERWLEVGVSTPHAILVRKSDPLEGLAGNLANRGITFPCLLKPNREGNSRGLDENSIVFDDASLWNKLADLFPIYDDVLIEEYLGCNPDIREFTTAMIGNGEHRIICPAEITLLRNKKYRIITTRDKDDHHTRAAPVEDEMLKGDLIEFARNAFDAAGVRDYARLDILMTGGQFYAIEINGQPMIPDRWFEVCSSDAGLDSGKYLQAIFLAGIVRHNSQGALLNIPSGLMKLLPDEILDIMSASAENLRV